VLESEDEFLNRYHSSGPSILQQLGEMGNARVEFGVDATRCDERNFPVAHFTDIIMNFPHPGGRTNLRKSRELLSGVLSSLSTTLLMPAGRHEPTRLHLSFTKGQSGLDKDLHNQQQLIDHPPPHRRDSWQVLELAARTGLRLEHRRLFDPSLFPDYHPVGYLKGEKGFSNASGAETLTFVKSQKFLPSEIGLAEAIRLECEGDLPAPYGLFHSLRPHHTPDISFLLDPTHELSVDQRQALLISFLQSSTRPLVRRIDELVHLRCEHRGHANRVYRMYWQGWEVPLSRQMGNALQEELRSRVKTATETGSLAGLGIVLSG